MACFDHDDTAPLIYCHVTLLGFDKNKQKKSEHKMNNFCTQIASTVYEPARYDVSFSEYSFGIRINYHV